MYSLTKQIFKQINYNVVWLGLVYYVNNFTMRVYLNSKERPELKKSSPVPCV